MSYHLAQLNIARFMLPPEDPINSEFIDNIDLVNQMAEKTPGFIWRLQTDSDENAVIDMQDDPNLIINMSVWKDMESLIQFTYGNPLHKNLMKRRKQWFEKIEAHLVLWWVAQGHIPDIAEAQQRMSHLKLHGPTPEAFTFAKAFYSNGTVYKNLHKKTA